MKYIAKGLVEQGSTEHILKIQRGGHTFQLTGIQAGLWLNGRFGFARQRRITPGIGRSCGISSAWAWQK